MQILDKIQGHGDLVALTEEQRQQLCQEIREYLISRLSKTGGHLASNLGVVELTVALETVFDTDKDRLVFDVGHQSYVHKLLTGRQADFDCLRQFGGMAGFPKPSESHTDAFVAGHASSSVSIALGMARARTLLQEDYHVIAMIGDGAATGGMAYEGLNDAAVSKEPMIIILNDNQMSIDHNVGGMAKHLSKLRTKERYLGMKDSYRHVLQKIPGGKFLYRVTKGVKDRVKRALLQTTMFENMGLDYLGPVDGHDLPELIRILGVAKKKKSAVVVHVMTQKGRGCSFAEEKPSEFHGVGKFDPETGETLGKGGSSFSDTFGKVMMELAQENDRICAITAAMPGGTGLLEFKQQYPNRLFDVGIAEEHAVSMAGGLAKQGMTPVVALYSTFLQRSYDQIIQDIALLGLHVVLAVDRAGLVGEDGETHHGVFDVGFLSQIPGMTVLCPACCAELEDMLKWAIGCCDGPVAVRYPRGGDRGLSVSAWEDGKQIQCHRNGKDITIVTYGAISNHVLDAAQMLAKQGVEATVLRLMTVKPLPVEELLAIVPDAPVVIVEETAANAGIGPMLAQELQKAERKQKVSLMNLGDSFVTHGSLQELYLHRGLDAESIAQRVTEVLANEN